MDPPAAVPAVNVVVWLVVSLDLAGSFAALAIGSIFLPLVLALILGFGSDTYRAPAHGATA